MPQRERRGAGSDWIGVALLSVCASVFRVLLDGQDLNFDFVTYHYYLGYSASVDRTAIDFLPAGFQGYQSPLPYAPLYLFDQWGVPPALNAALHATLHAANLVAVFGLCRILLGEIVTRRDRAARLGLWLLGAVAPVYWLLVGTSFADLTGSALALTGLFLVASGSEPRNRSRQWVLLCSGALLLGAATGLRAHNAIHVLAAVAAVAWVQLRHGAYARRALLGSLAAGASGWLACSLPWAWRAYREFGNPVFPLFNAFFQSVDFPAANLPLTSFVPDRWLDWALLPLRMATIGEWVYVESPLPDVRPALLVGCALALACRCAFDRIVRHSRGGAATAPAALFLYVHFGTGTALWLATSANGRYGVALLLLVGPVLGALLVRLLPLRPVLLIVAAVCMWQLAVQQVFFHLPRWSSAPWSDRHFDWDLPDSLARTPAVFLSFGYQTAAALAPRVHPQSRHVNLVGQYSIEHDGPGAARVRRIIDTPGLRSWGVFDTRFAQQDGLPTRSIRDYFGQHLNAWGFRFAAEPCVPATLKRSAAKWDALNRLLGLAYRGTRPELVLCALEPASRADTEGARRKLDEFRARIDRLAEACPALLGSPRFVVRQARDWTVQSFRSLEYRFEFGDRGPVLLQLLRPPYAALLLGDAAANPDPEWFRDCARWPEALAAAAARRR